MSKLFKKLFSRTVISLILVSLQLGVFFAVATKLRDYSIYIQIFFMILSAIVIVHIIASKSESIQIKLPWIVLIALFPVFGILWYYFYSENNMRKKFIRNLKQQTYTTKEATEGIRYIDDLENNQSIHRQAEYILKSCNMPIYKNTETKYFELGDVLYVSLLEEIKKAKNL